MDDFIPFSEEDISFQKAIELFNNQEWYFAHDELESIWHETVGMDAEKIMSGSRYFEYLVNKKKKLARSNKFHITPIGPRVLIPNNHMYKKSYRYINKDIKHINKPVKYINKYVNYTNTYLNET